MVSFIENNFLVCSIVLLCLNMALYYLIKGKGGALKGERLLSIFIFYAAFILTIFFVLKRAPKFDDFVLLIVAAVVSLLVPESWKLNRTNKES